MFLLLASTILLVMSRISLKGDEDKRLAREKEEARRLAQERAEARQLALKRQSISSSRKILRAATTSGVKRAPYPRRDFPSRRT